MSSVLSDARQKIADIEVRAGSAPDEEARRELQEVEKDVERYMESIDEHFMELVNEINAVEIFFARRKVEDG